MEGKAWGNSPFLQKRFPSLPEICNRWRLTSVPLFPSRRNAPEAFHRGAYGAPPPSRASNRSTEISSLLFLMSQSVTIIGIDPGSRNTGWGVVREVSGVRQLVDSGVIRPPLDGEFASRLGVIFKEMHRVLGRLKPDEASVEQVFTAKNAATALKLGQARGAAIAACAAYDLPVRDYEPTVIKKSLVGVGRADKEQVSFMVGRVLGVKPDWAVDTGDALAAAICHLTHRRFERLVRLSGR